MQAINLYTKLFIASSSLFVLLVLFLSQSDLFSNTLGHYNLGFAILFIIVSVDLAIRFLRRKKLVNPLPHGSFATRGNWTIFIVSFYTHFTILILTLFLLGNSFFAKQDIVVLNAKVLHKTRSCGVFWKIDFMYEGHKHTVNVTPEVWEKLEVDGIIKVKAKNGAFHRAIIIPFLEE